MRKNVTIGVVLALAAGVLVLVGTALGLELESVALLGAALGAVVALVPNRTAGVRLGGFAVGFVVAWVGYAVRAALLPDTSSGRAVAVFLVVLVCGLVAAGTSDWLPLWSLLLGTAGLTGAYELTYAAAPPEFLSTSLATASTLFLSVAVGFFAAAAAATTRGDASEHHDAHDTHPGTPGGAARTQTNDAGDRVALDEMMENSK
jgi:hypothetical protein